MKEKLTDETHPKERRQLNSRHARSAFGYTKGEERANAITHGVGIALAAAALVYFLFKTLQEGQPLSIFVYLAYAGSLLLMYSASTFYHLVKDPARKRLFKKLDHISIFFLIAGTYTPFLLLNIGGALGALFFIGIWLLALVGALMKTKFSGRRVKTSVVLYLAMGWLVVFLWDEIKLSLSTEALRWLVTGGLLYSGGTIFYLMKRMRYHHMIWHLCVLAASIFHFAAVATSSPF